MSQPTWVPEDVLLPTYEHFFNNTNYDILCFSVIGEYQGDYIILLKDFPRFGFIVIGYGSCSGCDELEAIYSNMNMRFTDLELKDWEEIDALRTKTLDSIQWFDTAHDMTEYIKIRDVANSWYGNEEEWSVVSNKMLEILEGYLEMSEEQ